MTTTFANDVITRHQMSATAYEKAFDRLCELRIDLRVAVSKMQQWRTVGFVNTESTDVEPAGRDVIDARQWPSASTMAEAVRNLRDAEQAYREAWEALPDEVRERTPLKIN